MVLWLYLPEIKTTFLKPFAKNGCSNYILSGKLTQSFHHYCLSIVSRFISLWQPPYMVISDRILKGFLIDFLRRIKLYLKANKF